MQTIAEKDVEIRERQRSLEDMQTLVDRTLEQIRKKEEELVLKNVELQQLRDANSR